MSDTANSPDAPSTHADALDERVQALLVEIDETTARIELAVADSPDDEAEEGAEAAGDDEAAEGGVADSVEASAAAPVAPVTPTASEAKSGPAPAPGATAESPPQPVATAAPEPQSVDELDADLEADLEKLLAAEAGADAAASAPASAGAAASVEIDPELESELDELLRQGEISAPGSARRQDEHEPSKLDEQLAGLGDEDLEGDEATGRPERAEVAAAAAAGDAEVAAPAVASGPSRSTATSGGATAAAAPAQPSGPSMLRQVSVEAVDLARRTGPRVAAQVEPLAYRVAALVSKPLEQQPSAKRIVGWLAVYTAFLAACVWVYILFLRPPALQPAPDGPAIVGASDEG